MSLDSRFNELLSELLNQSTQHVSPEELIQCIDLTLLDEHASNEALDELRYKAQKHNVAAVCVYSQHLANFYPAIKTLATVINFPHGTQNLNSSLDEITTAKELGALEIDYVLPYQSYLAGDKTQALRSCEAVVKKCKDNELKLKIIVETGAFPNQEMIYQVSKDLVALGCDFIKTSTGKIAQGASIAAAFAILSAIKDGNSTCGIKISGGVKTAEHAANYAKLASLMMRKKISANWFRIGASSLLDELISVY